MIGRCHICGQWGYVETHHIFGGANRKKSEKYGIVVPLCIDHHREGREAAHKSAVTAQQLHEYGQRLWMQRTGGTAEDFRAMFGKNYLDDDSPAEEENLPRGDFGEIAEVLGF